MEDFYTNLPDDHVLKTFFLEHEIILQTLDELSELNEHIQNISQTDLDDSVMTKLQSLATRLTDSEPHHQREEEALFPIMIKWGMAGPPNVMTMEHVSIRDYKHKLKDISVSYKNLIWKEVKDQTNDFSRNLYQMLRDHITKENTILYPMAFRGIPDESVWREMKKKCDKIGYCSFTPDK